MYRARQLVHLLRQTWFGAASLTLICCGGALAQEKAPPPAQLQKGPEGHILKLTLDEAINMALDKQPTIKAAQASLQSSLSAKSVTDTPFINLLPSGRFRKQQAVNGVSVSTANLQQVEMETKNAVNRTYLGVIYAREQLGLANEAVQTLKATLEVAKRLVESGDSKQVTKDDLDKLSYYILVAESKVGEAQVGMLRAQAALREAIGLEYNTPFEVDQGKLTRFYDIAQEYAKSNKVRLSCTKATEMAVKYRPELAQASLLADVTCLEVQAQSRVFCHFYSKTFAASSDIHSKILPSQIINGEYKPGPVGPEMPTYLVGNTKQRTERANHLYVRSLAVTDKARGLIALEAEEGCARLNRASEMIENLKQAKEKSSRLYQNAERFFRQDQLKTNDLLQAYAMDVTSKTQLNEQYYLFGMTLAYLQRATAGHLWECFEGQ